MEFRFNINEIFKDNVVEVDSTLIPPGFKGDKRSLWDSQAKIAQIVNAMGEASARAQGLNKPITTSDRLRNSEHKLYLLVDKDANDGKGAVTGMLKMGEKGLYIFDRQGQHYKVSPWCVLDFYVHESRQRSGYGKKLFEHMLQIEKTEPVKLAIDRPSDKFLGFLKKHYNLDAPIKQMNNYVVFEGFFPKCQDDSARQLQRAQDVEQQDQSSPSKKSSANGLQAFQGSPYGRYGAHRPTCSMGQIIHNDSGVVRNQEPTGVQSAPAQNVQPCGQQGFYSPPDPQSQVTQSTPNMHLAFQTQAQLIPQPIPKNQIQKIIEDQPNLNYECQENQSEQCLSEMPPQQQIQGYQPQYQSHQPQYQVHYIQPQYNQPAQAPSQAVPQYQTYQGHHPTQNDQSNYQMQIQYQDQIQCPPGAQVALNQTQLQGHVTVQEYDQQIQPDPCYQGEPCTNQYQYSQNQDGQQQGYEQQQQPDQIQMTYNEPQPQYEMHSQNSYSQNNQQPTNILGQRIQPQTLNRRKEPLIPPKIENVDRNQHYTNQPQTIQVHNNMYQNPLNQGYVFQNQPHVTQSVPGQVNSSQSVCHVPQSMPNQALYVQSQNQGIVMPMQSHVGLNQNYVASSQGHLPNNQIQGPNAPFQQGQNLNDQNVVSNVENYHSGENGQVYSQPHPTVPHVISPSEGYQDQYDSNCLVQGQTQPQNYQNQGHTNPNLITSMNEDPQGQPQSQNFYNQGQPQPQIYQNQGKTVEMNQPQVQLQPGVYYQPVQSNQAVSCTAVPQRSVVEPLQAQYALKDPRTARKNVPQGAKNAGDAPQMYPNLPFNGMQSITNLPKNQVPSKSVPNVPQSTGAHQNDLRCASVFPIQAGDRGGGRNTGDGHGGQKSILSMPSGGRQGHQGHQGNQGHQGQGHQRASRVTSGLDVNQRTKNATRTIKMNEYQPVDNQNRNNMNEIDVSRGYPPHTRQEEADGANSTHQKPERPQSLEILPVESQHKENGANEDLNGAETSKNPSNKVKIHENDGLDEEILKIEKDFDKTSVSPRGSTPGSVIKSPNYADAAGMASSGRNTPPGLTDKGYYDLKFFHNKLW